MDINIYTKGFSPDLILKIKNRFADFHMDIEFHPDFKFDEQTDTGFVPIKLRTQPGHIKPYDNFGSDVMTGFEIFFNDYDYEQEYQSIQSTSTESKSFFSKIFRSKKKNDFHVNNFVVDSELDKYLRNCKKDVMLNWKSRNKSELRVSLFFAAILAELTDGVIYDPQSGRYLNGQQALQTFPMEIEDYEKSFTQHDFTLDRFEGWI